MITLERMYILMSPRFLFGNVSQYLSELFHLKQFLRIVRTVPIEKPATGSGFSLLPRCSKENPEPVASPFQPILLYFNICHQNTVRRLHLHRFPFHHDQFLLIINRKRRNTVGFMIHNRQMLSVREQCNILRILPTDR